MDKKGVSNYEICNHVKKNLNSKTFKYLGDWDIDVFLYKKDRKIMMDIIDNCKKKIKGICLYTWGKKIKIAKHWVALILIGDKIYYFDPGADNKIRVKVMGLIEHLSTKKYKSFLYNTERVQHDKENCGIFCINFMHNISEGSTYREYLEKMKKIYEENNIDKYNKIINKLRDKYI